MSEPTFKRDLSSVKKLVAMSMAKQSDSPPTNNSSSRPPKDILVLIVATFLVYPLLNYIEIYMFIVAPN